VPPGVESLAHLLAVRGGRLALPPWSEMLCNRTIRGQETLGVPGGLEPWHTSFPFTHGLMRILHAVIEIAMLTMFHTGQEFPLGGTIAFEFIRDDDPRHIRQTVEELAQALLGGLLVPSALHQEVEHVAVLIHCPRQPMGLAIGCRASIFGAPRLMQKTCRG
jgi:hypothetical protein